MGVRRMKKNIRFLSAAIIQKMLSYLISAKDICPIGPKKFVNLELIFNFDT